MSHGGDEQVGVAIVVDVGERAAHRDVVRHREAGVPRDVDEATVADVFPKLIRTELGEEVEIGPAIAVDVRRAQPVAVVVVNELVVLPRVVDDAVLERDPALLTFVPEPEVVHDARRRSHLGFLVRALEQPRRWSRRVVSDRERAADHDCRGEA